MKIAVDAMGGDYAPGICIEGAAQALYDFPNVELVIVGHEKKLAYYLERYGIAKHSRISVVHAETVVEMWDPSTTSIRGKRDSSITTCAKLLRDGEVDGMISPGHTGAIVAATKVITRTLPGVDRPALVTSMPSVNGRFVQIDVGANVDCTPLNLAQFALMGEVYASYLLKLEHPRVGLLSVGGEAGKGNELTREVFSVLQKMPINFIGNVEGNTVFEGVADLVVSDGFSGNVLLKTSEGLAKLTMHWLKEVLSRNPVRYTGAILAKNAFRELRAYGDASEFGGAPLMGIKGICIIGHGSSNPRAVRNAIRVAAECHEFRLNEKIIRRIEENRELLESLS